MPGDVLAGEQVVCEPVTAERWNDLEQLFDAFKVLNECWCMWWRIPRKQFDAQVGEGNRLAMKAIVESGEAPGILAYLDGRPIGWCSVGPREAFPVLDRSRTLRRVDDMPVWSIVCFFVAPAHRGQGLMETLLRAAIDYAAGRGARVIEAYPILPVEDARPTDHAYTGVYSVFERLGFQEVARRSKVRAIVRYAVGGNM